MSKTHSQTKKGGLPPLQSTANDDKIYMDKGYLAMAQFGSALASGARGPGFKSR